MLIPNILNGNSVALRFSENCLLVSEIMEKIIGSNDKLSKRSTIIYNSREDTKSLLESKLI
jgi:hypothetical protein